MKAFGGRLCDSQAEALAPGGPREPYSMGGQRGLGAGSPIPPALMCAILQVHAANADSWHRDTSLPVLPSFPFFYTVSGMRPRTSPPPSLSINLSPWKRTFNARLSHFIIRRPPPPPHPPTPSSTQVHSVAGTSAVSAG